MFPSRVVSSSRVTMVPRIDEQLFHCVLQTPGFLAECVLIRHVQHVKMRNTLPDTNCPGRKSTSCRCFIYIEHWVKVNLP